MPKTVNPSGFAHQLTPQNRQWVQSVHKALNAGIDMGVPTGTNAATTGTNAGVYTQFKQGNGSGVLVRVQGNSDNESGVEYKWQPGSATTTIKHKLGRKPIGFHVVDMDQDVRVYRTEPPTEDTITLNCTNHNASVTLYIF